MKKWVWRVDFERFLNKRCVDTQREGQIKCRVFYNLSNSRFRSLIAWIQPIENAIKERSCVSFLAYFTRQKQFIQKTLKISAPNWFFHKKAKILLFNVGLFQQVLLTWNDNLAKEARRLKSKIEFEDWCKSDEETVGLPGAVRSRISRPIGKGA